MKIRAFALIILQFFGWSAVAGPLTPATIVRVIDGDTVVADLGDRHSRLRLASIDAPESRQPWGTEAHRALSKMVQGRHVDLYIFGLDQYNRAIAEIYVNDKSVNRQLVADGHAYVYRQYSNDRSLLRLEKQAQRNKLGLWTLPKRDRVPPWEWRKRDKAVDEKPFSGLAKLLSKLVLSF